MTADTSGKGSRDIATDLGPWEILLVKSNASEVQRMVVPWLIAMYGLTYAKSIKLDVIKQQIMAVTPLLGLLTNCKEVAEEYPVGLNDIARRVKAAAGKLSYPCSVKTQCSNCAPSTTERAMRNHRIDMRNTLISLFETPVPETDLVGREVLTRVLTVKPSDFEKLLIDIATNVHLQGLIPLRQQDSDFLSSF